MGKYGSRSSDISIKSLKKSKKLASSSINDVRLKRRNVPPSTTQVNTFLILYNLIDSPCSLQIFKQFFFDSLIKEKN